MSFINEAKLFHYCLGTLFLWFGVLSIRGEDFIVAAGCALAAAWSVVASFKTPSSDLTCLRILAFTSLTIWVVCVVGLIVDSNAINVSFPFGLYSGTVLLYSYNLKKKSEPEQK